MLAPLEALKSSFEGRQKDGRGMLDICSRPSQRVRAKSNSPPAGKMKMRARRVMSELWVECRSMFLGRRGSGRN